ncbi:MAG: PDZ domain-containing protein [Gemmataceae bacterium]
MLEPGVGGEETWNDLQPLVDEELSRLPDKYRTLVVLCDLEGRTRKEAARQLAAPKGPWRPAGARARTMLAKRLAAGAGLPCRVGRWRLSRLGPPRRARRAQVVSSTIAAATHFAAGPAATGMISPVVAALTEGVLKGMLLTKLKLAGAAFLGAGLVAGGTGMLIGQAERRRYRLCCPRRTWTKVPGTPGVSEKDRASAAEKKPADDPAEELRKAQEELRKAQEDLMRAQRKVHEAMRKMIESRIPGGGLGGGFGGAFPGGGFGGGGFGGFGPAAGARLGISVSKPAAALAEQLNLPEGQGLVLESVSAGSAGAKAGLKKNDILLELGGKKITNDVSALVKALDGFKTGDKVDAVILRMGKKETVKDLVMPEAPKGGFGGFGFTFPELPPPVRVVPEERKE